MALQFTTSYLADSTGVFLYYKKLAERAMAQLSDAELFATLDPESNSIAIIVKHMAGNMQSRWTDFLTSDGEKPGRDRDAEFSAYQVSGAELDIGGGTCSRAGSDRALLVGLQAHRQIERAHHGIKRNAKPFPGGRKSSWKRKINGTVEPHR